MQEHQSSSGNRWKLINGVLIFCFASLITHTLLENYTKDLTDNKNCSGICSIVSYGSVANTEDPFEYLYEHYSIDENKPTIIYIPGGPGGTSMRKRSFLTNLGHSVIYTDQRGAGRNPKIVKTPDSIFFHSKALAFDILKIIEARELTNYFIFASSYGSVVAAHLSTWLTQNNMPKPKAYILESPLGRSFKTEKEFQQSYSDQWESFLRHLPENARGQLTKEDPFSFGFRRSEWDEIISGIFYYGWGHFIKFFEQSPSELRSYLGSIVDRNERIKASSPIYQQIACREIIPNSHHWNTLFSKDAEGKMQFIPPPYPCPKKGSSNPFDIKNFAFDSTVYLLTGMLDPISPLWQAQYFNKNINNSQKTYMLAFPKEGHLPLRSHQIKNCRQDFWNKIRVEASIDLKVCDEL